jgi:hypothetical protein
MITDTTRLDEIENFVRWAEGHYSGILRGLHINATSDGDISVTVLGPDDCFTASNLRQALDDATLSLTSP